MRLRVALCLAGFAAAVEREGPAAHYVIRTSDLASTLAFAVEVLELKVVRHEENPTACPITCNGLYPTPWSKTMVGSDREDVAYALEVTYNYGVEGYARGSGLRRLEMIVSDASAAAAKARALGYAVSRPEPSPLSNDGLVDVTGPDGYCFSLATRVADGTTHRFASIVIGATDVLATAQWYMETLGMVRAARPQYGRHEGARAISLRFPQDAVALTIEPADSVVVEQWDGRNAYSLPAAKVREVYARLSATQPARVVHELQEINEETGLGVLLIAIVSDPNGLELCLVSAEAFEPAIAGAADWRLPDWAKRAELAAEYHANARAQPADKANEEASPFANAEL